jgi:hypothetical protein
LRSAKQSHVPPVVLRRVCLVRAAGLDADVEVVGCDDDGWVDRCEATCMAVRTVVLLAADGLAASCLRGALTITPFIRGVHCVLQSKVTYHW